MSNIFTEAIANCKPIPEDKLTSDLLNYFTAFIKEYGSILRKNQTVSFKFLITHDCYYVGNFRVILQPTNSNYGSFQKEIHNVPYGGIGLTNLLVNNGAKVTFDKAASDHDETYDHYLVELTIEE